MSKPNHLPNINPANNAIGDPNPAAKTQIIVNRRKSMESKKKFDFLNQS